LKKILFTVFGVSILLVGCHKDEIRDAFATPVPVHTVSISLFKCNCDPIVQESIQDTFVEEFFQRTNAKVGKGDKGEITIVGVVTMDQGAESEGHSSVMGNAYGVGGKSKNSAIVGHYISGISAQAYRNGELLATYSVGQNLGEGRPLKAPITLAHDAAYNIVWYLLHDNVIGSK
jgi:hypothetical protein